MPDSAGVGCSLAIGCCASMARRWLQEVSLQTGRALHQTKYQTACLLSLTSGLTPGHSIRLKTCSLKFVS